MLLSRNAQHLQLHAHQVTFHKGVSVQRTELCCEENAVDLIKELHHICIHLLRYSILKCTMLWLVRTRSYSCASHSRVQWWFVPVPYGILIFVYDEIRKLGVRRNPGSKQSVLNHMHDPYTVSLYLPPYGLPTSMCLMSFRLVG